MLYHVITFALILLTYGLLRRKFRQRPWWAAAIAEVVFAATYLVVTLAALAPNTWENCFEYMAYRGEAWLMVFGPLPGCLAATIWYLVDAVRLVRRSEERRRTLPVTLAATALVLVLPVINLLYFCHII